MIRKKNSPQSDRLIENDRIRFAMEMGAVLKRRWFASTFTPPLDHRMAGLMFTGYAFCSMGAVINKKTACSFVDVADMKTARKYVARSIELGFFNVIKSDEDARADLLFASDYLKNLVEQEIVAMSPLVIVRDISAKNKVLASETFGGLPAPQMVRAVRRKKARKKMK